MRSLFDSKNSQLARSGFILLLSALVAAAMPAQEKDDETIQAAPPRTEGEGPFERMVLRGATMIDGTGAPPIGPVDIVIENDRIVQVSVVGHPGAWRSVLGAQAMVVAGPGLCRRATCAAT